MAQEQEYDRAKNSKVHYLNFNKKNFKEKNFSKKNDQHAQENSLAKTIRDFIVANKPNIPVYCVRPHAIKRAAKFFVKNFIKLPSANL